MSAPRSGITHRNDSQGFFKAGRLATLVVTSLTMLLCQEDVVYGVPGGHQLRGWDDFQSSLDDLPSAETKICQCATEIFATNAAARHCHRIEFNDQLHGGVSLAQLSH